MIHQKNTQTAFFRLLYYSEFDMFINVVATNILTPPILKGTATSDAFKHSPTQPFEVQPVLALIGRVI